METEILNRLKELMTQCDNDFWIALDQLENEYKKEYTRQELIELYDNDQGA